MLSQNLTRFVGPKIFSTSLRFAVVALSVIVLLTALSGGARRVKAAVDAPGRSAEGFDEVIVNNAKDLFSEGRRIFRFETFGDQAFWGGTLQLHEALKTVTPAQAVAPGGMKGGLGLKVDIDRLPANVIERLRHGHVNLNDPPGRWPS
jgi:hypothetical protein